MNKSLLRRALLSLLLLCVVAPALTNVAGCKHDGDEVEVDGPNM